MRVIRDGDDAVIEVSDKGKGMTSDFVRDRLFKPFYTTKDAGTGIGAYETSSTSSRLEADSKSTVHRIKEPASVSGCALPTEQTAETGT